MAVDVDALAAALRGDRDAETNSILSRLQGVGAALVERHGGDGVPEAVQDEAVIRVAAYLYDQPQAGSAGRYAAAWRNSGAAALVSPWKERRLGIVGDE